MLFVISKQVANPLTAAETQAANVLRAWITCDETRFRLEVGKTLDLCSVRATAGEEEQIELLKAVATSLKTAPLGSATSTLVYLCIDLLAHLSHQPWSNGRISRRQSATID